MDQKQIARQMVQFNKTAFDNSFKAMSMVLEQNEKMVNALLEQAVLPEDGKKAIKEWMTTYKSGCDDFKKVVDESYAKVEAYFSAAN